MSTKAGIIVTDTNGDRLYFYQHSDVYLGREIPTDLPERNIPPGKINREMPTDLPIRSFGLPNEGIYQETTEQVEDRGGEFRLAETGTSALPFIILFFIIVYIMQVRSRRRN